MSAPGRGGRGRRSAWESEEANTEERWMASYMDMVTVLLVLFIILFAMSSVDVAKFQKLKNSLATGFGTVNVGNIDTAEGVVVPPDQLDSAGKEPLDPVMAKPDPAKVDFSKATNELDELKAIKKSIDAQLTKMSLNSSVAYELDERGLTVQLIGSETFFHPNNAELTSRAEKIMNAIAPSLVKANHELSIEGHADYRGQSFPYPTDWELSAARATNVLRHLVETGTFPADKIGAVGYGSARPAATGSTAKDLSLNRRVDIVVLANDPVMLKELLETTPAIP